MKDNYNKKLNIIYLLSTGRSGSTLLSLLLDNHSSIFSLGEVKNLPAFIRLHWRCGCGVDINNCEFWESILKIYHEDLCAFSLLSTEEGKFKRMLRFLYPTNISLKDRIRIKLEYEIYNSILKKTNTNWLVDSSKDFNRLLYLINSKLFNIKVIFLARDGRGFVNSMKKPLHFQALVRNNLDPMPVWKSSIVWSKRNLINLCMVTHILKKKDWIMVRYEELADNPSKELKRICSFIGIKYEESMFDFSKNTNHNIGGNRMRFKKNQEIKLDEDWKCNLTKKERVIFSFIGGFVNKILMKIE